MKQTIALLMLVCGFTSAFGKDAPTSAEQLRSEVEAAFRAKDTTAFLALFNWQGVSQKMKSLNASAAPFTVKRDIAEVKLTPLPREFRVTNVVSGIRYKPNVSVLGLIKVIFADKQTNFVEMPYGKEGNFFYITGIIEEKLPGPVIKSKTVNIVVKGSGATKIENLSGSYVFVMGGEEIKENFTGKGQFSKGFRCDYLQSCTVQKTSADKDKIQLILEEDGQTIFESTAVTNREPIVYTRK